MEIDLALYMMIYFAIILVNLYIFLYFSTNLLSVALARRYQLSLRVFRARVNAHFWPLHVHWVLHREDTDIMFENLSLIAISVC